MGGVKSAAKIKCSFWPKCHKQDGTCEFVHPTENCQYFPKCTYGDKCLFVHPEIQCKFAESCTRPNCAYKHPQGHRRPPTMTSFSMMNPILLQMSKAFSQSMGGMGGGGQMNPGANKQSSFHGKKPEASAPSENLPAAPKSSAPSSKPTEGPQT